MGADELRKVFGLFATGVTVVTCLDTDDDRAHGATVTAFTPVSLDPPLVQISLARTSKACTILAGRPFAINILSENQVDVAWHFAGRRSEHAPVLRKGTPPVLAGNAATISCQPWAAYDGGDHVLFVGEITALALGDGDPLLFHRSVFKSIGPQLQASAWTCCSDDPTTGWFDASTTFVASRELARS